MLREGSTVQWCVQSFFNRSIVQRKGYVPQLGTLAACVRPAAAAIHKPASSLGLGNHLLRHLLGHLLRHLRRLRLSFHERELHCRDETRQGGAVPRSARRGACMRVCMRAVCDEATSEAASRACPRTPRIADVSEGDDARDGVMMYMMT